MSTNNPGQGRELNEQNQRDQEQRQGANQPSRQDISTAPQQEERDEDLLTERADQDIEEDEDPEN